MARRDLTLAFDDIVHGTGDHYSSSWMDLHLAEYETFMLQVVVDALGGQLQTTTIQIETSGDGRQWVNKNPSPEINLASTPSSVTTVVYGRDMGSAMSGAMVRLRVQLAGTNPSAKVKVYVREGNDRVLVPWRIQGLVACLRADIGVELDASNGIQYWRDTSPNGHDAQQTTSTRRPSLVTSQFGGLPSVFFDASSGGNEKYFSILGSFSTLTSAHFFVVHRRVAAFPPSSVRAGFWRFGTSALASRVPFTDSFVYDDAGSNTQYNGGGFVVDMSNPNCYEVRADTASWSSYINGTLQYPNPGNTFGFSTTPQLGGHSTVGTYYDGYIAELLIYDHVLTDSQRLLLVGYLNDRYKLSMT